MRKNQRKIDTFKRHFPEAQVFNVGGDDYVTVGNTTVNIDASNFKLQDAIKEVKDARAIQSEQSES